MTTSTTTRRQRPTSTPAVSSNMSAFLSCGTAPRTGLTFVQTTCRPYNDSSVPRDLIFGTKVARSRTPTRRPCPILMVTAVPPKIDSPRPISRFSRPVPAAKPHEILPPRRGRNSRRRTKEAEHFRKYIYLRRQLKPWSDAFRAKHGRTPSLIDVHASDIPGLMDRFVEYLEALERLRLDV